MNYSRPPRTFSSREFNQDTAGAKRAASHGPVIITDRGTPAFVLLTYENFQLLDKRPKSLREALMVKNPEADFDFDFPEMGKNVLFKPFEFD